MNLQIHGHLLEEANNDEEFINLKQQALDRLKQLEKKTLAEQEAFEKLPKSCCNYDYFEAL